MASIGDYIFLTIVLSVIFGIAYAIRSSKVQENVSSATKGMKEKGISFSESGMSIKTDRRAMTREEYIDRAQRSFAEGGEAIAAHKNAFSTSASRKQAEAEQEAKARRLNAVPQAK